MALRLLKSRGALESLSEEISVEVERNNGESVAEGAQNVLLLATEKKVFGFDLLEVFRVAIGRHDSNDLLPWCTTRDLGPQLSFTHGFEVPHEHFQTHSAEVCEEGLSREELA